MANTILTKSLATANPALTLDSLANGAGRVSTQVDNATVRGTGAWVGVSFRVGTSPVANSLVKFYLIRESNSFKGGWFSAATDSELSDTDAAVTIEPKASPLIGTVAVDATSDEYYKAVFWVPNPGPKFQVLEWNATGAAFHGTQPTNTLSVETVCEEIQ